MDAAGFADPVGAVLDAHRRGGVLALRTAGTTGTARAVLRSTASWWSSFDAYGELSGVGPGACVWVPGPLTSTMNLFAAVHAGVVGAVLAERPEDASHACLTPAQLDRRGDELRRGTRVVVAGAALSPRRAAAAASLGLGTAHYYGAAELSFVAAGTHAGDLTAYPGAEVEVRDDEIWVRSPFLASGYAGDPGPLRLDDAGWATVGDRGRLEGDRLVVEGRPDIVVTAGANVRPSEVEAVLGSVAVGALAVVGVPHETLGALLVAVLTDPDDLAAVQRQARQSLPASHQPRVWRTLDRLPLTGAGKVDRHVLGELFAETLS